MPIPRQYNFIYKKLVKQPDDLIGLFAYGIYKEKKIGYIEDFRKRTGNDPNDIDLEEFNRLSLLHINEYRKNAESQLSEIFRDFLENNLNEFRQAQIEATREGCRQVQREELRGFFEKERPTFWHLVWSGIVGSSAFVLFLVLMTFILRMFDINVVNVIMDKLLIPMVS